MYHITTQNSLSRARLTIHEREKKVKMAPARKRQGRRRRASLAPTSVDEPLCADRDSRTGSRRLAAKDGEEVVYLERAVLWQVGAVHGVPDLGLAIERAQ